MGDWNDNNFKSGVDIGSNYLVNEHKNMLDFQFQFLGLCAILEKG